MSLSNCQNEHFSCGTCCGIFNLKCSNKDLLALLGARTEQINAIISQNGNFNTARKGLLAYRYQQEAFEASFIRHDEGTYVCPFLGFTNLENKQMGCMLHPSITHEPLSQNISFYGASICQTYDCPNKKNADAIEYSKIISHYSQEPEENFLEAVKIYFPTSFLHPIKKEKKEVLCSRYSRLIADRAFFILLNSINKAKKGKLFQTLINVGGNYDERQVMIELTFRQLLSLRVIFLEEKGIHSFEIVD